MTPPAPPPDAARPQVAGRFDRSFADFERACLVLLDDEQRRANPDNAVIAVLCDAVRLAREQVAPLLAPPDAAVVPRDSIAELVRKARIAVTELRDAARLGRVIDFRQRDPLVIAIHDALDALTAAQQRIAHLTAVCNESNAVCACGCPPSEHENLGEDGESCGHDDHQCVRTNHAVMAMLTAAQEARHQAEHLLQESKREHSVRCRAYGNYQPPYEDCSCGADTWNERVDEILGSRLPPEEGTR